jgi:hypothetical protein
MLIAVGDDKGKAVPFQRFVSEGAVLYRYTTVICELVWCRGTFESHASEDRSEAEIRTWRGRMHGMKGNNVKGGPEYSNGTGEETRYLRCRDGGTNTEKVIICGESCFEGPPGWLPVGQIRRIRYISFSGQQVTWEINASRVVAAVAVVYVCVWLCEERLA